MMSINTANLKKCWKWTLGFTYCVFGRGAPSYIYSKDKATPRQAQDERRDTGLTSFGSFAPPKKKTVQALITQSAKSQIINTIQTTHLRSYNRAQAPSYKRLEADTLRQAQGERFKFFIFITRRCGFLHIILTPEMYEHAPTSDIYLHTQSTHYIRGCPSTTIKLSSTRHQNPFVIPPIHQYPYPQFSPLSMSPCCGC